MIRRMVSSALLACLVSAWSAAAELHVSPQGDDKNPGTAASPLRTFAAAQQAARQARAQVPGPVAVLFHAGTYYLPKTIVFSAADSGDRDNPVTYAAAPGQQAVLSGGVRLELSWQAHRDGIMKARTPHGLVADQLFVDGRRQAMARYPNFDPGVRIYNGHSADCTSPDREARWADPRGGYLHAMHKAMWGGFHYAITGKDASGRITYEGGWQNNRPAPMHDKYRFVENIFEELDAPGEWFLDSRAGTLYFFPPVGLDPAKATIEAVRLRHLVEFRGSREKPVRFVTLKGFTLRHAARTFMDTREPLLRSDWTIYRGGAVLFDGAEDCAMENCTLDQLGGNALFVNNYNRRVAVRGCDIDRAGASGVCFVGDRDAVRCPRTWQDRQKFEGLDLAPGPRSENYPADCTVDDCLIRASGRVEKQSAGVEIDIARRIVVRNCSIYDVPRSGINIGDGCFGGHTIEFCDVFDTVLETGDHGSFNSWGRDRFWNLAGADLNRVTLGPNRDFPLLDVVEPITIRNNRWRCDHGWDVDLDDGSSNYRIYNNLCLHGGLKLREGFYRTVENNVVAGNSFHPHVWFENSDDVFRRNIVCTPYRPIRVPKPWGKECDNNLLHQPGQPAATPAKTLQEQSGRDAHSLEGDARFVDPARGNFQVQPGSPALKLGFVNFPMDGFGVRSARLRAMARTPVIPDLTARTAEEKPSRDGRIAVWLGAKVKNVVGLGEVSASGLHGEVGVLVVEAPAGSDAAKAGLRPGDVVLRLDRHATNSLDDLVRAYRGVGSGKTARLTVFRDQREVGIALQGHASPK